MLYRVLRFVNEWYAIALLWVFIMAFVLAFAFIFVFPQVTLILFFIGLAGMGMAVIGSQMLHAFERALARQMLQAGVCPQCRQRQSIITAHGQPWTCTNCAAVFTATGDPVLPQSNVDQR